MGLKEVFSKVSAIEPEITELASQQVLLGALQDIEKELIAASSGAIKSIDMAKAAIKPAQTSLQLNKQLLGKLQSFTQQIKELGITSPQKEVEIGITQVKENIQAIDNLIKNLLSI